MCSIICVWFMFYFFMVVVLYYLFPLVNFNMVLELGWPWLSHESGLILRKHDFYELLSVHRVCRSSYSLLRKMEFTYLKDEEQLYKRNNSQRSGAYFESPFWGHFFLPYIYFYVHGYTCMVGGTEVTIDVIKGRRNMILWDMRRI